MLTLSDPSADARDSAWIVARNRKLAPTARTCQNEVPCVYRGVRYRSLVRAARATGDKMCVVRKFAKREKGGAK